MLVTDKPWGDKPCIIHLLWGVFVRCYVCEKTVPAAIGEDPGGARYYMFPETWHYYGGEALMCCLECVKEFGDAGNR